MSKVLILAVLVVCLLETIFALRCYTCDSLLVNQRDCADEPQQTDKYLQNCIAGVNEGVCVKYRVTNMTSNAVLQIMRRCYVNCDRAKKNAGAWPMIGLWSVQCCVTDGCNNF